MSDASRVLLVDDDRTFRLSTAELLRQDGHEVEVAADAAEADRMLRAAPFDLLLLDLRMPGLDGLEMVEVLRTRGRDIPILMISGFGTVESAVMALHLGADDFLTKPLDPDVLSGRVAELLDRRPTAERVGHGPVAGMIGRSAPMRDVFAAIRRVGPTDTTVLLTGETGTGKELVARAVHDASHRSGGPFVPVNCASLAEGLLESELFGHARGAFTGALRDRSGLFEAAREGTLFLDEVGDVGLRLQQILLRVLQEREVVRVGETRPRPVDVRVVAATNRDLAAEAEAGRFRQDLYYRLNVFRIHLPPLRERPGDVALLVEAAVRRVGERLPEGHRLEVSPLAMKMLRGHHWPGNVRELMAAIESAAIRAGEGRIQAQHLPEAVRLGSDSGSGERYARPDSEEEEKVRIADALRRCDGVRSQAAELLGMSRTTLWRKMRQYGL